MSARPEAGERDLRRLAVRAFSMAQPVATPPLAACETVLREFTDATAKFGYDVVARWLDAEASAWRMIKRTSPYSGAPLEAASEETP